MLRLKKRLWCESKLRQLFCFQRAYHGFFYPKTALVDEEDATFYEKESLSVNESCEVEVDEPSSDSPQLPVEDAHDIIQSKIDQGEFLLFFNELLSLLAWFFSYYFRSANFVVVVIQ